MITQFITVVEECNRKSLTGEMFVASLEQFVLEMGTSMGINTENTTHAAHVTSSMFKELWLFGREHDIFLAQPFVLLPWRTNDPFIMEEFVNAGFSPKELWSLNETRLFLQVITLSDICDVQGL